MTRAALWEKHRPLALKLAKQFYFPGAEADDVRQEAMVALWDAAMKYDESKGSFTSFARIVVDSHLKDCLTRARRPKHLILAAAVRESYDADVLATLPYLHQVHDQVEQREDLERIAEAMKLLSPWQRHCVLRVADGATLMEVGPVKSVDNALYRGRLKIREAMAA